MVKVKSNRSKLSSAEENKHLVDKDLESNITLSHPVQDKRKKKTLLLSGGLAVLGLTATLGYLGQNEFDPSTNNASYNGIPEFKKTTFSGVEEVLSNLDDEQEQQYFQAADANDDGHVTKKEFKAFIREQVAGDTHALKHFKKCIKDNWPANVSSYVVGKELHEFESDFQHCIHNAEQTASFAEMTLQDENNFLSGEDQLIHMTAGDEHALYELIIQKAGAVNKKSIIDVITLKEEDIFVERKLIKCVEKLYPVGVESMSETKFHAFRNQVTDCETAIVPHPVTSPTTFEAEEEAVINATSEDEAAFFESIGTSGQTSFTKDQVSGGLMKYFGSADPEFADEITNCVDAEWPAKVKSMNTRKLHDFKKQVGDCLDMHRGGPLDFPGDISSQEMSEELPYPEMSKEFPYPDLDIYEPGFSSPEMGSFEPEFKKTTFSGVEEVLSNLDDEQEQQYFQAADANDDGHVTKKEFRAFIREQVAGDTHTLKHFKKCIKDNWPANVSSYVVGKELHEFESDFQHCIHNAEQSASFVGMALQDENNSLNGEDQLIHMTAGDEHALYELIIQKAGAVNKKSIIDVITLKEDDIFVERKLIKCVEKLYPVGVESMSETKFHAFRNQVTDCETAIVPHPVTGPTTFEAEEEAVINATSEDEAAFFESIGTSGQTSFTKDQVSGGLMKYFGSADPEFADEMTFCVDAEWPAKVKSMNTRKLHDFKKQVGDCLDMHRGGPLDFPGDEDDESF